MSKELDEAWTTIYHYNDEIIHDMGSEYVDNPLKEEIDIVNNALLELKAIKEAKPSEALKWLDQIIEYITEDKKVKYKATILFDCEIIKDALLKAQEMEKENDKLKGQVNYLTEVGTEYQKILKIIKEKNVDIALLKECKNESEYNIEVQCHNENLMKPLEWWIRGKLTKEEFELLKRWLG